VKEKRTIFLKVLKIGKEDKFLPYLHTYIHGVENKNIYA